MDGQNFAMFDKKNILILVAVIIASAWLMSLIDDGLGFGWPQNVVRNWQQFGLFNLHGKLVRNPGGFDVAANPQIYKGMSPVCLYPVYFTTIIFRWTGLGTLSFHILLTITVLWGTSKLLGKNHFAVIVAAAAVLCPCYMRSQKVLDPNTLAVLAVIPFAAIVLAILKNQNPRRLLMILIFFLTFCFMSLNWTSAWVCGPCILLFLGTPRVNPRSLILFVAITVISGLTIVGASVLAKLGVGKTGITPSHFTDFLSGYTWGNTGYGEGLTTGKAFLRLAFVNGVGLFPLWVALIYAISGAVRHDAQFPWLTLAPLGLIFLEIGAMRDYFAHHPPMAGPLLLVGVVFSLSLLKVSLAEKIPQKIVPITALICFIYGLAVLMFFHANQANLLSLAGLVRAHTARSDIIAVVKNADPKTAALAYRLDEFLDRHVIVVDDPKDPAAGKNHCVVLSSVKLNGSLTLIAQSSAAPQSPLNRVDDWFNHSIARRNPGDRLELSETYFLYEPKG